VRAPRSSSVRRTGHLLGAVLLIVSALSGSLSGGFVTAADAGTTSGTVTGLVFDDYDVNGVRLASEPGVAGVTVRAFDATGALVGTTVTAADGTYSLPVTDAATADLRIEFIVPDGFAPSFAPAGGSTVRFVQVGATAVNLGVHDPHQYCQANPLVACTIVDRTTTTFQTLRTFAWNNSGSTVGVATMAETGGTWGLAWQQQTRTLVSAPTVRRNTKVYESPDGTPRLGQLFASTTTGRSASTSARSRTGRRG